MKISKECKRCVHRKKKCCLHACFQGLKYTSDEYINYLKDPKCIDVYEDECLYYRKKKFKLLQHIISW